MVKFWNNKLKNTGTNLTSYQVFSIHVLRLSHTDFMLYKNCFSSFHCNRLLREICLWMENVGVNFVISIFNFSQNIFAAVTSPTYYLFSANLDKARYNFVW